MNVLEKIDELMRQNGISTRRELSVKSGIPYTTISGFYAKGYEKMKLSTLKALADCFGVSIDYLGRDEITDPHYGLSSPAAPVSDLTADETQLIDDYRSLNEQGQEYIRQTMYMAKQTHKKMPDLSDPEKQA